MGHVDLFSNLFRGQTGGFQKYCATAHAEGVALALAKAIFQLQTLLVCQLYNFDFAIAVCLYVFTQRYAKNLI